MRPLYFPREQFSTITADDITARPLAAPVAPLALGYDERSMQANIQHVENPRRAVTSWLRLKIATQLAQQAPPRCNRRSPFCAEVSSKMGILSVATSCSRRTDAT